MPRWRLAFIAVVSLAQWGHLAWEHFHGGVATHHILQRADLPAISNWWGALLLPGLAWFLTGRIQRRVEHPSGGTGNKSTIPWSVVAGFGVALLLGTLLAVSFESGARSMTSTVFQATLLLALLLPAYRAECLLGFVLGMAHTFGAILPTGVGSIIATGSAIIQLGLRPLLVRCWRWFSHAP